MINLIDGSLRNLINQRNLKLKRSLRIEVMGNNVKFNSPNLDLIRDHNFNSKQQRKFIRTFKLSYVTNDFSLIAMSNMHYGSYKFIYGKNKSGSEEYDYLSHDTFMVRINPYGLILEDTGYLSELTLLAENLTSNFWSSMLEKRKQLKQEKKGKKKLPSPTDEPGPY